MSKSVSSSATAYNPSGARCGERISAADFMFAAYQLGVPEVEEVLRRHLERVHPIPVQAFWIGCIDREKDHPLHG